MRTRTQYIVATMVSVMLVSMFAVVPASAFINPNATTNPKWELFGPHLDQLIFQFYSGDDNMFTALQTGQVDLVDDALTTTWRDTFSNAPYNKYINIVSAGGQAGFYIVDFNEDPYQYVPNSVRAPYHNPVFTDSISFPGLPPSVKIPPISTNVFFRIGVDCLFNYTQWIAILGAAGVPIYTPLPSYMGGYIANVGPYTFSHTLAEANFTAGHILQNKATTPWHRYWDYNNNGVEDPGEADAAIVVLTYRSTHYRLDAGQMLLAQLQFMNFTVPQGAYAPPPSHTGGVRDGGGNYQQVMLDKNYHMTTLGWISIGPDPDFLYDLYHVSSFWDDPASSSPNTADLNDTVLNTAAEGIKFAPDPATAKANALLFQQRFFAINAQLPLYAAAAYQANAKYYSGGNNGVHVGGGNLEDPYRTVGGGASAPRNEWLDFANLAGIGSDNFYSYLNGYPNGSLYGNGAMTLRYGWRETAYPEHINPFYSEWYWDTIILGAIYDTPGTRDPYDLSTWRPILIKDWSVGTWVDPVDGSTKSKVTLTLRPDMTWQDGTPITMADVVFSLVEAGQLMISRGFAPPWWWPTGELVRSTSIKDAYTVEILYNVYSYLVQSWTLGGIFIVPKHIWKPIILSPTGPVGFSPDPDLIGSSAWRFSSMTSLVSAVMVANKPGSVVTCKKNGLALVGALKSATPTASPVGYYNYWPKYVNVHTLLVLQNITKVNPANPVASQWYMEEPYPGYKFNLTTYTPSGEPPFTGTFNESAHVTLVPMGTPPLCFDPNGLQYHVFLTEWNGTNYVLKVDYYNARLLLGPYPITAPPPVMPHVTQNGAFYTKWIPAEIGIELSNWWLNDSFGGDLIVNKYVYVDGKLQPGFPHDVTLKTTPGPDGYTVPDKEELTLNLSGIPTLHTITVAVHIKGPSTVFNGQAQVANPWISHWDNVTLRVWITSMMDIAGSTFYDDIGLSGYAYKTELPTPDDKVDMKDIGRAARAFGSYPGHPRWDSVSDVNKDYKVDMKDIGAIARQFGWTPDP